MQSKSAANEFDSFHLGAILASPLCSAGNSFQGADVVIRKLSSGKYRLYSRKANPSTGKRRNLGTFNSRAAAEKHERAVQYFKHH